MIRRADVAVGVVLDPMLPPEHPVVVTRPDRDVTIVNVRPETAPDVVMDLLPWSLNAFEMSVITDTVRRASRAAETVEGWVPDELLVA